MRSLNKFKIIVCLFGILALQILIVNAENAKNNNTNNNHNNAVLSPNAADCVIPSGNTYLTVNNIRCRINTGGDMFWDLAGSAKYEIPKGSLKHSMFAGSLWIGGVDANGQNLRVAAVVHRGSNNTEIDFWPGPLTIDGNASIDKTLCKQFDKFFKISRADVENFVATGKITENIKKYPGNGVDLLNQSHFLAPFKDVDGDFIYNPEKGDYPYYDLKNTLCDSIGIGKIPTSEEKYYKYNTSTNIVKIKGTSLADQILKGDETIWWVFNDKGNTHSQSNGLPIGMEIRAQAFGFSTSDEINNMTFYTYELINRSSIALYDTYFSQWVDTDLGNAFDDFVGCDVQRGLGYCYNGTPKDGTGKFNEYGDNPPAIGVDYFQGPYMNPNNIADPKGLDSNGNVLCDESINGFGFGDTVVDNERLGMQRFVYHNNGGHPNTSDPDIAIHFYNYLRGKWKDGAQMMYGGNGYNTACGYPNGITANFMFPGTTDPCNWGTAGQNPMGLCGNKIWSEKAYGNSPADRRFMQSSGPFRLDPGAVNYITVGIPWARAANQGGDPFQSVVLLQYVDDKAQRLFDNCFRVINGPDAPTLTATEFDREILLFIDNQKSVSNNYRIKPEDYQEGDYNIVTPPGQPKRDTIYRFEGYQLFQLKDESVSSADLWDSNKARVVAQCDIKNFKSNGDPIGRILNYNYDQVLNSWVGQEMVNGSNKGIVHSFRIFKDLFAQGSDDQLVNHKKYYYMAIAYAFNEYSPYSQDPQVANGLFGQQKPYLPGRKSPYGPIKVLTVIPHKTVNGLTANSNYGFVPEITKLEGQGNGGRIIDFTEESEMFLVKNYNVFNQKIPIEIKYKENAGPINVKIVDPLKVQDGEFALKFFANNDTNLKVATWKLYLKNANNNYDLIDTSLKNIELPYEQFLQNYGIAISINQVDPISNYKGLLREDVLLGSSIEFSDTSKQWLTGIIDGEECGSTNWISCGTNDDKMCLDVSYSYKEPGSTFTKIVFLDPNSQFEKLINRTWAPYRFAVQNKSTNNFTGPLVTDALLDGTVSNLASINVVFTKDTSLWTRSCVIEMQNAAPSSEGNAKQFYLRKGSSVDKMGNPDGTGTGMGWFPGYAINVETGERLNIVFGEDSKLISQNGRDMKWNPVTNYNDSSFGGKHYIYIVGHVKDSIKTGGTYTKYECPAYDGGAWIQQQLMTNNDANRRIVYRNMFYVTIPILAKGHQLLSTDCKVRIRISKPYEKNYALKHNYASVSENNNFPMYKFSLKGLKTTYTEEKLENDLDLISVVPNPYFAYSSYEFDQLDNRVKIINLPKKCTVKIYNLNGTLVRDFTKDDESSFSIEWDLKNKAGLKVSSGMYLIHVKADGLGERVVKWYGVLRPTDLNSF